MATSTRKGVDNLKRLGNIQTLLRFIDFLILAVATFLWFWTSAGDKHSSVRSFFLAWNIFFPVWIFFISPKLKKRFKKSSPRTELPS